jgi:uncharacterized membrane protein YedE/YeeE
MPTFETLFPLGITHYLVGGLFIGAAVSLLFLTTGLVGGMSTIFTSTWSYVVRLPWFQQEQFTQSRNWRVIYALGLILGAAVWMATIGDPFVTGVSWWQLVVGGFVAGFGARMSNGCTSGHGICGLASLQVPSLLAVLIFLATGMISAAVVKLLGGV